MSGGKSTWETRGGFNHQGAIGRGFPGWFFPWKTPLLGGPSDHPLVAPMQREGFTLAREVKAAQKRPQGAEPFGELGG